MDAAVLSHLWESVRKTDGAGLYRTSLGQAGGSAVITKWESYQNG